MASQTAGRRDQHPIQLASLRAIPQSVQAGPVQARSTVAIIPEDVFVQQAPPHLLDLGPQPLQLLVSGLGFGLGRWLMECILAEPDLQGLLRFMLATLDKQGFYGRFGFEALRYPERHLERLAPGYYP